MKNYVFFFILISQQSMSGVIDTLSNHYIIRAARILNLHGIKHEITTNNSDQKDTFKKYCKKTNGQSVTTFSVEFADYLTESDVLYDDKTFSSDELSEVIQHLEW